MGVLDGKVAIVTGSARGIGRATAELLSEQGASVLINDLDGDVAEQTASEIAGETTVYAGDLTKEGAADELVADRDRRLGQDRHHRQQRGLHDRRADPQDVRRRVPADARHPHDRPVPRHPRGRPAPARARQEGARGAARRSSARSSTSPRSRARWATPARPTTRPARPRVVGLTKTLAKEWGQFKINVNAVAFGWIETRLTASKVDDNTMEIGGEKVQLGIPDQMRGMASMLIPLGRTGTPGGGRRRRVLPLLAVVELRPRPGAQHHGRAVHGDDDVSAPRAGVRSRRSARRTSPTCSRSCAATPTSTGLAVRRGPAGALARADRRPGARGRAVPRPRPATARRSASPPCSGCGRR